MSTPIGVRNPRGADSATRVRFNHDVLRFDVTPEQLSHMESLAIYFPMVLRDDAVMRLHWGTTSVPIRIKAPFRPRQ